MKTKLLLTGLVVSAATLSIAQKSHAEETQPAQGLNKIGSAHVQITPGDEIITPPEIKPYPPTGPMLPVKDLGITSATDLYFDSLALNSTTSTKDALYINADGTPISNVIPKGGTLPEVPLDGEAYVPGYSVTDRRGTGAGWNLTLTLGDFVEQNVTTGATAHTLKGATLVFPQVVPDTTADAIDSIPPTTYAKKISAGGSPEVLMSASSGQGMGIWEAKYNSRDLKLSDGEIAKKEPIQLSVPGNNYAGQYKATLTWNLADGPSTN